MLVQGMIVGYAAVLGLLVGSAINAIVWRLYVGRNWVRGRSECPDCGHRLAARDLVPVLSWVLLRGRCRYCQARIHWQYPAVEVLTAGLFGLSVYALWPVGMWAWVMAGLWLVMLTLLIVLAVYDLRWMILPDKIMVPLVGLAVVYVGLRAVEYGSLAPAYGPVAAALVGGGVFYLIAALSQGRAMGGGDIKLVFVMGLLLGLKGLMLALLLAFNAGAVVGVTLIALKLKKRRDHIPFGPFLVAGTVVAFLYGQALVQWYLSLSGLV